MTITVQDQALATIWELPDHGEPSSAERRSMIVAAAEQILQALASAVGNVALRTVQLRKAAKVSIALQTFLEAYQRDPAASAENVVSVTRPRPDEVEAKVRAGFGPEADTFAKAVALMKATGRPYPSRDELVQAAEFMAARGLIDERQAALVAILIQ